MEVLYYYYIVCDIIGADRFVYSIDVISVDNELSDTNMPGAVAGPYYTRERASEECRRLQRQAIRM